MTVRAGIINVTGYAGAELARLLMFHPEVQLVGVTGRGGAGHPLGEVFPHLERLGLLISADLTESCDVVFSALPHKASAEACRDALDSGAKVIDISADFRLKDPNTYAMWYQTDHPAVNLLDEAVYGLTELNRDDLRGARLVANPGCYPTGAILALAPALKNRLIEPDIVVDSKSGVSGAGRGLSLTTHFCEANENVSPYALGGHRHWPEMLQELLRYTNEGLALTFVPHLIPMTRGILSTGYARLKPGVTASQVREAYLESYRNEPFARLVLAAAPQTKHTLGNNDCLIQPVVDERTGRLIAISALDNLVKGAAGQAIQNMNVMYGYPETLGLDQRAVYP